jgi:hypothetical protein
MHLPIFHVAKASLYSQVFQEDSYTAKNATKTFSTAVDMYKI